MKYEYGKNLFHEVDLQKKMVELTGKWVVHLIAEGLRDYPERARDFLEFYVDKIEHVEILNALYSAPSDRKEAYVFIDNLDDARNAYEHWFPNRSELFDDEKHLHVEMIIMGPNGFFFSNEGLEPPTPPDEIVYV